MNIKLKCWNPFVAVSAKQSIEITIVYRAANATMHQLKHWKYGMDLAMWIVNDRHCVYTFVWNFFDFVRMPSQIEESVPVGKYKYAITDNDILLFPETKETSFYDVSSISIVVVVFIFIFYSIPVWLQTQLCPTWAPFIIIYNDSHFSIELNAIVSMSFNIVSFFLWCLSSSSSFKCIMHKENMSVWMKRLCTRTTLKREWNDFYYFSCHELLNVEIKLGLRTRCIAAYFAFAYAQIDALKLKIQCRIQFAFRRLFSLFLSHNFKCHISFELDISLYPVSVQNAFSFKTENEMQK